MAKMCVSQRVASPPRMNTRSQQKDTMTKKSTLGVYADKAPLKVHELLNPVSPVLSCKTAALQDVTNVPKVSKGKRTLADSHKPVGIAKGRTGKLKSAKIAIVAKAPAKTKGDEQAIAATFDIQPTSMGKKSVQKGKAALTNRRGEETKYSKQTGSDTKAVAVNATGAVDESPKILRNGKVRHSIASVATTGGTSKKRKSSDSLESVAKRCHATQQAAVSVKSGKTGGVSGKSIGHASAPAETPELRPIAISSDSPSPELHYSPTPPPILHDTPLSTKALPEPIDIDGFDDEKYLAEYGDELLMHLATLEGEMITEDYYPDKQPHLSSSLRGEAYNWLLKLNAQLRVPAETLLVTMNILDRFLAIRTVDERAYWLAFFTALRLACKYTTIKMPDLKWCEQICFKKFTRSEFLTSEAAMLKVLKFRLSCPTAHNFLSRFSKVDGKPDDEVHTAAKAIAQISCLDVGFIGYRPSAIATASVFLARKALSRADWDPMEIGEVTGYVWGEVKGIYDFMLEFLRAPIRHHCFFAPARAGEPVNPIVGIRKWALKTKGN